MAFDVGNSAGFAAGAAVDGAAVAVAPGAIAFDSGIVRSRGGMAGAAIGAERLLPFRPDTQQGSVVNRASALGWHLPIGFCAPGLIQVQDRH